MEQTRPDTTLSDQPQQQQQPQPRETKHSPLSRIFQLKSFQVPVHTPKAGHELELPDRSIPLVLDSSTTNDTQYHVEGCPAFKIATSCFVVPTMRIPFEQLRLWEDSHKERVEHELWTWIRQYCDRRCLVLQMIHDGAARARPCLVLICWNDARCDTHQHQERLRRQVQKRFRNQESMKLCPFPCKVIVSKTELTHRLAATRPISWTANCVVVPRSGPQGCSDLTGAAIKLQGVQICTLGGLLWVGDEVFAITVAHPFYQDKIASAMGAPMASTPEFNSSLSLESDWSESDSGEEDLFRDFSDQIASAPMRRLPVGYTQPGDDSGTALPMGSIISGQVSCPFPTRDMPYQSFADWVLLKLATPSPALQNGYVDPRTGSLVMIEHIQPTMPEPGTEVYVLAGSQGTLMATVGQSLIRLHLHDLEMSVTQICLQKPLSRGTSGSWVVWEQSVIGYVVAGQELMPLAYIIPFRAFLESAGGDFAMAQIALRPPRVLHASDRTTIAVEEPDTTQIVRSSLRTETQAETLATHASPPTDPPSYHQPPEMSQKDQLLSRLAQQGIKASLAHTNGYQDQQVDVASSPARPHQATKKRASTSSIPWPGLDDDELDALLDLPHHRRFPPRSSRTAPLPPSPSLFNPRRCLHCGSSSHDASCCPERLFAHH